MYKIPPGGGGGGSIASSRPIKMYFINVLMAFERYTFHKSIGYWDIKNLEIKNLNCRINKLSRVMGFQQCGIHIYRILNFIGFRYFCLI